MSVLSDKRLTNDLIAVSNAIYNNTDNDDWFRGYAYSVREQLLAAQRMAKEIDNPKWRAYLLLEALEGWKKVGGNELP